MLQWVEARAGAGQARAGGEVEEPQEVIQVAEVALGDKRKLVNHAIQEAQAESQVQPEETEVGHDKGGVIKDKEMGSEEVTEEVNQEARLKGRR